ncbi:MAG: fatty acid desaturase [Gammaproteobacteria bacterium]
MFRYTRLDAIPVGGFVIYATLLVAMVALGDRLLANPGLAIGFLLVLLLLFNLGIHGYHYHQHTPFFRSSRLNAAVNLLCSAAWSYPMCVYAHTHFLHHEPNSVATTPTYRDAAGWKGALQHVGLSWKGLFLQLDVLKLIPILHLLRYEHEASPHAENDRRSSFPGTKAWYHPAQRAFSSVFWDLFATESVFNPAPHVRLTYQLAKDRRRWGTVVSETLAVTAFRVVLAVLDWRTFLLLYVPWEYIINSVFRSWTDYVDHYGAYLDDPSRNSASCYGSLFNVISLNGGYHMEHHFRAGLHWTKLRGVRNKLPDENERRVTPLHYLNPLFPRHAAQAPGAHVSRGPL